MNLIKYLIRKIIENYSISNITGNLGKIGIKNDKVSILVSNDMLLRRRDRNLFSICFSNLDRFSSLNKKLPKELNRKLECKNIPERLINKPVHYTIKNMDFDGKIDFSLEENTTLTFENCTFRDSIKIRGKGKVIFRANTYICSNTYGKNTVPLLDIEAKDVTFQDEEFFNRAKESENRKVYFGMRINAGVVNIVDSQLDTLNPNNAIEIKSNRVNIETSKIYPKQMRVNTRFFSLKYSRILGKDTKVDISADKSEIKDSKIACTEIKMETDIIDSSESSLEASKEIEVENQGCNPIEIKSPKIIYNSLNLRGGKITINPRFIAALIEQYGLLNALLQIEEGKALRIGTRKPINSLG